MQDAPDLRGAGDFSAENPGGRNLHFGVREHAMGAILNGLSLSKIRPYGSGFLIFSDYGRPAIRLSALMELPVIYIFTHDSIGVGEDGPTHQPVEQLASLRAIPGLITLRPADANEVVEAWRVIMQRRHEPVALVLTRQAVPTLDRSRCAPADGLQRGAYVLLDAPDGPPEVLLLATGSEVSLCVEAHRRLEAEGIRTRVVSMPSWELFERTAASIRSTANTCCRSAVTARVSVEQGSTFGWARYVGAAGVAIGMETFGASAPLAGAAEEVRLHAGEHRGAARRRGRWRGRVEMRVAIGSDHAGFELKETLKAFLAGKHGEVLDVGTHGRRGRRLRGLRRGRRRRAARAPRRRGIILCGSGVGASMAANRSPASAPASATTPIPRTRASSTTT